MSLARRSTPATPVPVAGISSGLFGVNLGDPALGMQPITHSLTCVKSGGGSGCGATCDGIDWYNDARWEGCQSMNNPRCPASVCSGKDAAAPRFSEWESPFRYGETA